MWRWKDWIDRRFMRKFNELPEMAASAPPPAAGVADAAALKELSALAMRCGGCGAKVGASVLSRALAAVEPAARDDVVIGLDATTRLSSTAEAKLSVHTVDYFRAFIDDPYFFGKIAAVHALGDVYAMGGEPQSALAIATVPYGLEAKVEADLAMMMTGATRCFATQAARSSAGIPAKAPNSPSAFPSRGSWSGRRCSARRAAARRCPHPDETDRHGRCSPPTCGKGAGALGRCRHRP